MRIVTLCTCGLGTCFALKIKVEEVLERMGITCDVIPCDLGSADLEQADLYILPYGLEADTTFLGRAEILVVEDILDLDEIEEKLSNYFKDRGEKGQ